MPEPSLAFLVPNYLTYIPLLRSGHPTKRDTSTLHMPEVVFDAAFDAIDAYSSFNYVLRYNVI